MIPAVSIRMMGSVPVSVAPDAWSPEPVTVRHSADKLALLCRERPARFVLVRACAIAAALLIVSFVFDALAFLFALIASNPFVLFFAIGDAKGDDDRAVLMDGAGGLPLDIPRLIALILAVVSLLVTELACTRGLPSGISAMQKTVIDGLPWPGRWRLAARIARQIRPWLIVGIGIAGTVALYLSFGWPPAAVDLIGLPFFLGVAIGAAWFVVHAGRIGGRALTNLFPSNLGVTSMALAQAELAVRENDAEDAHLEWPVLPSLHFRAAAQVFGAPPLPGRRSERVRHASWANCTTSIESLATELVFQAVVEAHRRGFLVLSDVQSRHPGVVAKLPVSSQPAGLAALVLGYHREGETLGRTVAGRLTRMLDAVCSTDQYAQVIEIALHDLADADAAQLQGNIWTISADRLSAIAGKADPGSEPIVEQSSAAPLTRRESLHLRKTIRRTLRSKSQTDASAATLLSMLTGVVTQINERRRRRRYQLPQSLREHSQVSGDL